MNMLKIRNELIRDEGVRLKPYMDSVGKLTIGVGRNLDDVGITSNEAAMLLDNDILLTMSALDRSLPWWRELDENRQRVLINMAFNLGINGLLKFKTTLKFVESGDYHLAAASMMKSKWAKQVGSRAERLSVMMLKGGK